MTSSHVDHEWVEIVQTIRNANYQTLPRWSWSKSWTNLVWFALYSTHLGHQPLGLHIAPPPPQFHGMWKIHGSCKELPCDGNSHVFFIHILQYLFITWNRSEMIAIRRRITLTWRKHLWSQMKMKREMFGMNSSLYSPKP